MDKQLTTQCFSLHQEGEEGFTTKFVGLDSTENFLFCCTEKGLAKTYSVGIGKESFSDGHSFRLPQNLERARVNGNIVACGGKNQGLKVWDMGALCNSGEEHKAIFVAKNAKPDMLNLQQPIWITDLQFSGAGSNEILVSTKYKEICMYDIRAQKRPLFSREVSANPINLLQKIPADDNCILYSDSVSNMAKYDYRMRKVSGHFRGFTGAPTSIYTSADMVNKVVTTSLDRFLRVHSLEPGHALVGKVYLKQKLSGVAFGGSFPEKREEVCAGAQDHSHE